MAYLQEPPSWRRRRRRRHQITLVLVLLLLLGAGVVAAGYYTGRLGGPTDSAAAPPKPTCRTATARPTRATRAPALSPTTVRVNVYNTTPTNGLAARVAANLRQRKFVIRAVANDPQDSKPAGTAVVRYGPKGTAAARLVAAQVPRATLQRDGRRSATVDLVIGKAFRTLAPVARPSAAPRPTPCT
jgi:hypothetical protein